MYLYKELNIALINLSFYACQQVVPILPFPQPTELPKDYAECFGI